MSLNLTFTERERMALGAMFPQHYRCIPTNVNALSAPPESSPIHSTAKFGTTKLREKCWANQHKSRKGETGGETGKSSCPTRNPGEVCPGR